MLKKIAVIDKSPNKTNYKKYFDFEFDHFHMCSTPMAKVLKKDIDLDFEPDFYDLIILIGSEACKHYAKITSVTNYAGQLVNDKYVPITNPGILSFKPEGKIDFERSVARLHKIISGEVTNAASDGDYKGIDNLAEALAFLREVLDSNAPYVAVDTETTALYPRDGYVLGVSISYKPRHGRYILTDVMDDECLDLLQQICDKYIIVFHNLKFDYKMLAYHLGIKFNRMTVEDTMVMHYVLDENDSHSLKALALKYTDYGDYDAELDAFKKSYCRQHGIKEEDFTYDLIPYDIMCKYASCDTAVTWELRGKFRKIIDANPRLLWVYQNLLINGTLFLMDMEEVGIPMSAQRLAAAGKYLYKNIDKALAKVYEFKEVKLFEKDHGDKFNPNSTLQLRKVLFDYAKLTPTGKLTKAGAISTDAEVLEELAEEHELPKAILQVRKLNKILSSYISKILPELDKDGRIRTNFNAIFTTSGRLSSSGKFNAQQIPRDDPIIKGCIVAPVGYKIVSQDLRTAEVYYAAVLSKDKNLQAVFQSGGDLHSTIAKMVFNLECDVGLVKKLYPALRQAAKAITFGILYGSGPKKVAETVTKETGEYYSLDTAKENIKDYFTKFSKLKSWLNQRKDFIEANGFTYSFFGRKRRLINVFSADKGIAAHEVRSGINSEIQSLASDVNLLGAMDTAEAVKHLDAKIFMLVHDSIVALVKDEHVEEYCKLLKQCTQKDRGCGIEGFPVGVDQDIGQDYSFEHFEEVYFINDAQELEKKDATK